MSALLAFFGGTAFRLIFGEIMAFINKRQDHVLEVERMRLQGELDTAQHERNQAAIRLQAELGIKTIAVQADADAARLDAGAWAEAVAAVGRPSGIRWIDAWNGAIRPGLATLAIGVVVAEVATAGFALGDWHREIVGGILGIYIADRSLSKRGK